MVSLSRREFLKLGVLASAAAATGLGSASARELFLRKLSEEEIRAMKERIKRGEVEVKYTADVMCAAECALEVWVKDGRAVRIYGNPHLTYNSGGAACAKAQAGLNLEYSPYRVKFPLKRVGERGEGKFVRISWEQAVDEIARKLVEIKKKYGPEAVIMDTGDVTDRDQYWRLFFAYGTPNCVEHGAICDTPRRHGPKLIVGGKRWEPDIYRPCLVRKPDGSLEWYNKHDAKLIIYCGWNPFTATRISWESRGTVRAKLENDCKVIVLDPALSNTAAKADEWIPIRPSTIGDFYAAMLRYILEHDDPANPERRYIDHEIFNEKYVEGLEEFIQAFKSWWNKVDPATGHKYFTLEWAEARTGIPKEKIEEIAHLYGITKPAALVWGMQSPGHNYNGYCTSILGVVLNIITGNFDRKGGIIDTELTKCSKGSPARGKHFLKRKVKRVVNGREVEGEQEKLHYSKYGDWPAAWDDVVGDLPRMIQEGIELKYGPFRGHKYPIAAYFLRTGNSLITAAPPYKWIEALTAKKANGEYKCELFVVIDTLFLESAMYADYILPEASYLERMSLSDIYPTHPVIYLREPVVEPLHEAKKPTDIMNMLAKKIHEYELKELGRSDVKPEDFWEKYKSEEDFVNDMLLETPGRPNVGRPLPYPNLPEGYKLIGTPESLEEGRVEIDHDKKVVKGEIITVKYLREHYGGAIWPMSWERFRVWDAKAQDWKPGGILKTKTKKFELHFHRYEKYNKLIEESGVVPFGIRELGWSKYPTTFYWFETRWNPYTNREFRKYKDEYPFQLIYGRTHHGMTATQVCEWTAQTPAEALWLPLNEKFEFVMSEVAPGGREMGEVRKTLREGMWCIGTVQMNMEDAERLGIKTGDIVLLENPLGRKAPAKAFVCKSIRPGVLRIGLGSGGRFAPGLGGTYFHRKYTPLTNELTEYKQTPIMGMTIFAEMLVKVRKVTLREAEKLSPSYVTRRYSIPGVNA